jgi:hypothetical protein
VRVPLDARRIRRCGGWFCVCRRSASPYWTKEEEVFGSFGEGRLVQ